MSFVVHCGMQVRLAQVPKFFPCGDPGPQDFGTLWGLQVLLAPSASGSCFPTCCPHLHPTTHKPEGDLGLFSFSVEQSAGISHSWVRQSDLKIQGGAVGARKNLHYCEANDVKLTLGVTFNRMATGVSLLPFSPGSYSFAPSGCSLVSSFSDPLLFCLLKDPPLPFSFSAEQDGLDCGTLDIPSDLAIYS